MIDLFSLTGRTALVTGGSSAIGAAITAEFLKAGARVIVGARRSAELDQSLAVPGPVEAVRADLSSLNGVQTLMAEVARRTDHLDVLVNNLGAVWSAPLEEPAEVDWHEPMDLDVRTLHYLTIAALPLLRACATGDDPARVINIGSVDGIEAATSKARAYAASRTAVHRLTRQHAERLADQHILVNAIAPGVIDVLAAHETSTRWLRRSGRAEEIGGSAVYLASRAGAFTTGTVMVVDDGTAGSGRAPGLLG